METTLIYSLEVIRYPYNWTHIFFLSIYLISWKIATCHERAML